jgi:Putative zinc-finger
MRITCKEASRLISAGLDTQLTLAQRTSLRLHLALCDACNKMKAQFEFLRRALSTYRNPDPDRRDDIH